MNHIKIILLFAVAFVLVSLSVSATFYRGLILQDFNILEITEDPLGEVPESPADNDFESE